MAPITSTFASPSVVSSLPSFVYSATMPKSEKAFIKLGGPVTGITILGIELQKTSVLPPS